MMNRPLDEGVVFCKEKVDVPFLNYYRILERNKNQSVAENGAEIYYLNCFLFDSSVEYKDTQEITNFMIIIIFSIRNYF